MKYHPQFLPKVRSAEIMRNANGKPCTLRISSLIPGHTCSDDATTVACHIPTGSRGMGTKASDLSVVYACSNCHDILDQRDRSKWGFIKQHYEMQFWQSLIRAHDETLAMMLSEGTIVVPDGDIIRPGAWRSL